MRVSFIHNTKSAWHGDGEVFADLVSENGAYRVTFRVQPSMNFADGVYKATVTVTVDPTEWFFKVNRMMSGGNDLTIEQRDTGISLVGINPAFVATIDTDRATWLGTLDHSGAMVKA